MARSSARTTSRRGKLKQPRSRKKSLQKSGQKSRKSAGTRSRKVRQQPKQRGATITRLVRKIERAIQPEQVPLENLFAFLSEFLAVEHGGTELYAAALERATNEETREKYHHFLEQTERHAEILTHIIEELDGDPGYLSPGAIVQQQLARTMLNLKVPAELRELRDAENLLIAETKDHADWEFLKKISSRIEDERAEELIGEAVSEVEDEEDEHLEFAKETVSTLALRIAVGRIGVSERRRAQAA